MNCEQGSLSPCGKNLCCWSCAEREHCPDACISYSSEKAAMEHCPDIITEEKALTIFSTKAVGVIKAMTDLLKKKKELEEQEKTVREQLLAAMETHGVKCFENELLKVTYKAASTRSGVDSKLLKQNYPEVFKAVQTSIPVKSSIAISLK